MKKIDFDGLRNCRDIGGCRTTDGHEVKTGYILRSDSLQALSEKDVCFLKENYQLRLIIDLRTDVEIEEKPDVMIGGARYARIPIFRSSTVGVTRETGIMGVLNNVPDMVRLYWYMVSDPDAASQFGTVIKEIISCDGGVIYHCTAGKDRTGLVTMMLYGMLGVSEDEIMKDYLATNDYALPEARAFYEMSLKKNGDETAARGIYKAFSADKDFLGSALTFIHMKYGSISDYCRKALDITDKEASDFRSRMLI